MSISTGKGDKGETSLWSGERVAKDSIRVEAYGTIDELNSHLGEAKHFVEQDEVKKIIPEIQDDLFKVAGELATLDKKYSNPLSESDVKKLTDYVHHFEDIIGLKGFVIPGSLVCSAKLDVCRTIARRAERRIISLNREQVIKPHIIQYVNRLSDLLFILARFEEFKQDKIIYKQY